MSRVKGRKDLNENINDQALFSPNPNPNSSPNPNPNPDPNPDPDPNPAPTPTPNPTPTPTPGQALFNQIVRGRDVTAAQLEAQPAFLAEKGREMPYSLEQVTSP